jgi:hypothetical protein
MEQLLQSVQHLDQWGRHGRGRGGDWEARSGGKIEGVQVPSYPGNMGDKTKEEIPEVIRVGGVQLM